MQQIDLFMRKYISLNQQQGLQSIIDGFQLFSAKNKAFEVQLVYPSLSASFPHPENNHERTPQEGYDNSLSNIQTYKMEFICATILFFRIILKGSFTNSFEPYHTIYFISLAKKQQILFFNPFQSLNMVSEIIMIKILIVIKLLLFKSMISKNIKKSSEFLLITPDYLKLKDSRQQNIKKTTTTLLSPKSLKISSSSNLQINQRTKIIQCLNKNRKSKAIQKVKSISPRNKDNSEINIQKVKRVESNSKTKNKNKKQQQIKQSFDKWKIEFFDSVNKKARIKSYYKQLNGSKTFEDDEYQKKQDKYKISSIEQNTMCTQLNKNLKNLYNRSKNILSIYKEKLKQTKKLNKTLMMQNNQLKNRLNKYQKF